MHSMIRKLQISMAAVFLFPVLIAEASVPPVEKYKWKNRVLVLLAPAGDSSLARQKVKLNSNAAALKERDVIILEENDPSGPLHLYFKPQARFTAILIGKDGGTKWQSATVFDPQIVFDKIDSMPMRAQEKRN